MKRPILVLYMLVLCLFTAIASASDKTAPDLDGLPDLIVSDMLGQQWVVREENLPANFCSVIEGGVTPGWRELIRFTVTTPNIGTADVFIGDPNSHFEANDGLFEYSNCHNHLHFRHYAKYELIDPGTGYVWRAAKRGFCMLDTDPNPAWLGGAPGPNYYLSCSRNQGVSAGWSDTYRFFLGGQYFVLDGGDGQPPVPSGDYILRITVNPGYVPEQGEPCRYPDPNHKRVCHQLLESNYENNVAETIVRIPDHPGRDGVGPLKNEKPLGYEPAEH